jgi:hypothetical protein
VDHPPLLETEATTLEEQMQSVLELMNARAVGRATNEQVEAAVERMLQQQPPPEEATAKHPAKKPEPKIEQDTENYDFDDEEEEVEEKKPESEPVVKEEPPVKRRGRGRPRKRTKPDVDYTVYEEIPLGAQGAKMMTTFGDGKRPRPAAVEAALLGTRRRLQAVVQDARHVRRQQRKLYKEAQESMRSYKPKKPEERLRSELSSELLFRATAEGNDRLSYDPPCGFDLDELRQLLPEEMNAYTRWNQMHAAAAEGKKSSENSNKNNNGDKTDNEEEWTEPEEEPDASGHLRERAAQFDVRTDKMKEDWYMNFSELRAMGSFLSKRGKQDSGATNVGSGWGNMSKQAIRFLHWAGFEPGTALPPPNEGTADALAFLAYDFLGRIVEKAICLRNIEKQKRSSGQVNEADMLLELSQGEQLEVQDIARAMEDPDIKPVPLYSGAAEKEKQHVGTQLYFGPGFEDRLEMEMEEMLAGGSLKLSEEERKVRQEEDELFARLDHPPSDGKKKRSRSSMEITTRAKRKRG